MTNQHYDFIWNGLGNKELTDSETSSSSEEGDKTVIDPLEVFALLEFCWIYFKKKAANDSNSESVHIKKVPEVPASVVK
jgi:hypothetical protein